MTALTSTESRLHFSQLQTVIPKCAGVNDFRHRVFLVTNELANEETIDILARQKIAGNAIMGVSGFFTLNLASVRGTRAEGNETIEYLILFDRSLRVEHFWAHMKPIIQNSNTRIQLLTSMARLLTENQNDYYDGYFTNDPIAPQTIRLSQYRSLDKEIANGNSWLSDDIKFARIKKIFDQNHFLFLRLDLSDPKSFKCLKNELTQRNINLDTIYISNILEYMKTTDSVRKCAESVMEVIHPQTLIIDTIERTYMEKSSGHPTQRVRRAHGADLKKVFKLSDEPPSQPLLTASDREKIAALSASFRQMAASKASDSADPQQAAPAANQD